MNEEIRNYAREQEQEYVCCLCDGSGRTEFQYKDFEDLLNQNASLEEDSKVLAALFRAGVDNWEGWHVAMEDLDDDN